MTIDILCRVVDNLGDIGFAYRLARALSELPDAVELRLVVDDLAAFAGLCPGVDPASALQSVGGWTVVRWNDPGDEAVRLFLAERPRAVIECYACGRPEWFESILFDEADPHPRLIVNLEYLTAESWARDFHRLPSLTRSPLVKKAIFMPGFESGTGGLLLDSPFCALLDACASPEGCLATRRAALSVLESGESGLAPSLCGDKLGNTDLRGDDLGASAIHSAELCTLDLRAAPAGFQPDTAFWTLVFSYEHDFSPIVGDLAAFAADRPVLALVASGRSAAPFLEAWERAGSPFPVLLLPLLAQNQWDQFLAASDFAIVRGEESFSRSCLSGHPFLWECYPFGGNVPAGEDGVEAPEEGESSGGSDALEEGVAGGQMTQGGAEALAGQDEVEASRASEAPEEGVAGGQMTQGGRITHGDQLPKVHSFLDLVKPFLEPGDFAAYKRLTLRFNGDPAAFSGEPASGDLLSPEQSAGDFLAVLRAQAGLSAGFGAWSRKVRDIGNLAVNLLTFIRDLG